MVHEFVQQIKNTMQEVLTNVHTALPAKIVSVNTKDGLATVQPTVKRTLSNGTSLDYPQISGVPIVLPQGAGQLVSIAVPVKSGDSCLLIISEQSLEYWLYGRETDTTLLFDLSNAICIPGLFQKPPDSFAAACSNNAVIIDAGNTRIITKSTGVIVDGSLTITGNLTVNGWTLVDKGMYAHGVYDYNRE